MAVVGTTVVLTTALTTALTTVAVTAVTAVAPVAVTAAHRKTSETERSRDRGTVPWARRDDRDAAAIPPGHVSFAISVHTDAAQWVGLAA